MKKLVFTAVVFAVALAVHADIMLWMVSSDVANGNVSGVDAAVEGSTSPYAYLLVSDSNSNLSGNRIASLTSGEVFELNSWSDYQQTDISTYAGTSPMKYFYVELYNGLRTDPMSYSDALNNGYIYAEGTSIPTTLTTGGGFGQSAATSTYNVPEPTSGLLFLIGGMLLGLKRRRQA